MLFKLNILGENDKVVKTYETSKIKMGLVEDLVGLSDEMSGKSEIEQFKAIKPILFAMFPGLTNDELKFVEFAEILATVKALMKCVNDGFGLNEKN